MGLAVLLAIIGAGTTTPAYATVSAVTAKNLPNLKEGVVYHGLVVGSFTGADVASSYSATVTWGDGTTGEASVADDTFNPGAGKFVVFISPSIQTPPYADEGSFPIAITVFDGTDRSATTSMNTATATVGESDSLKLKGVEIATTVGKPFSGTVATVTNTFTGTPASDFTATINWGDGSGNPPGVVSGSGGNFTVTGAHTYGTAGTFGIAISVRDDSPGTASVGSLSSFAHVVDATTTGVSSSANPGVSGQSLVFNALVSHTSGSAVPSGSVVFSDGSTTLGTVALSAAAASFSTSTLGVGDHTITASYSGDSNYAASSGSTLQTVTGSPITDPPSLFDGPTISLGSILPRALVPDRGSGPDATSSAKRGARVTFDLSRAATVTFTVRRKTSGRKVGGRCVRQTRANRRKKTCSHLVLSGTFTRVGVAGSNSFHLTGRAHGRRLGRGSYVLSAVATDAAGKRSKAASRPFRIIG